MTGTYNSAFAPASSASVSLPGYDASTFTADHLAFKDECASIFVRNVLDFCDPRAGHMPGHMPCNVAFLDDFDGSDVKELRTTKALGICPGICPAGRRRSSKSPPHGEP